VGKREDGKETRRKLLSAALEVFAQKGYRDSRVADICRRAGANVASVNYYFGNKASLYEEAWRNALQKLVELPFFGPVADSPQGRLREYIQTLIRHYTAKGELGQFSRLYLMELVNPTGLIKDAWREMIQPQRRKLHGIIREIIGPEVDELTVLFCEMSIVSQCRALVTIKASDLKYMLGQPLSPQLVERLASHIADFSIEGIKAAGKFTAR
jgi:TetR/AcrR family transcriptional regulator, regulator of cefoperazone and chloramphenicol sensitivity